VLYIGKKMKYQLTGTRYGRATHADWPDRFQAFSLSLSVSLSVSNPDFDCDSDTDSDPGNNFISLQNKKLSLNWMLRVGCSMLNVHLSNIDKLPSHDIKLSLKKQNDEVAMKIYPYPSADAEKRVSTITGRGLSYTKKAYADVTRILEDVRINGDGALIRYTNEFDAPKLRITDLKVTPDEIKLAEIAVDRSFTRSLNRAASQIETFHRKQVQNSWMTADRPGTLLDQLVRSVDRVGVYVPGGKGGNTPLPPGT